MKLTLRQLRRLVREHMGSGSREAPPESEFVDGPDQHAGYIVVREKQSDEPIAFAPITRTDGPDRPFLVRTTDTSWLIPHWVVKLIYPQIEDVFNHIDSKADWRNMSPGSSGTVGEFKWLWADEIR